MNKHSDNYFDYKNKNTITIKTRKIKGKNASKIRITKYHPY